ncbi:helix-turn-helix domain-containing protein [Actinomadura sp.]|uniref:helix-turn-helix domain-containing protein n=1 Tax=Actinomadura sp. TaxID=1989 RepID=UPI0037CC8767
MGRSNKRTVNRPTFVDGWDFGPEWVIRPGEVARMFGVHRRTVARWAERGELASIRTPGGERRYSRQQVEHLLSDGAVTGG